MFRRNKKNSRSEKSVALRTVDMERERMKKEKRARKKTEFMKFVVETGNSFE